MPALDESCVSVSVYSNGKSMLVPMTLAFSAPVGDRSLALRAEYRVKQLTKLQKERLVAEGAGFAELLSSLQTPEIKSD